MNEIFAMLTFILFPYCVVICSMIFLITSMFTSHWINVSRNETMYYYGLSLYCFNGTSSSHDINDDQTRFRDKIGLDLLKILIVICLALHIILMIESYVLGKLKRQLVLYLTVIITSIALLGVKITAIALFCYHSKKTVGYNIDWSFWILVVSAIICLSVLILYLIKLAWYQKSLSRTYMIQETDSIDDTEWVNIESNGVSTSMNNTSNFILSRYGSIQMVLLTHHTGF